MKNEIKTKKRTSDLSILYIDNNTSLQAKISTHLKKIFSNVYQAYNGVEGLEKYKQTKPDIVLTDLNLLNKNAFEMIVEMQELQPKISVVVLSYRNSDFSLLETLDIGIVALLQKPVHFSSLNRALQKIILSKPNKIMAKKTIAKKIIPTQIRAKQTSPVPEKKLAIVKAPLVKTAPVKPKPIARVIKKEENISKPKKVDSILVPEVKKEIPLLCSDILLSSLKNKEEITCINNYKGLVLNNNAPLLKVNKNIFTIQIPKTQLISILLEKQIIINIQKHYIKAKLIDVDKKNNIATFTNPIFLDFQQRDTLNKRIIVDKSFKASIGFNNMHIELIPMNISAGYINLQSNEPLDIKVNDTVDLTLGFEINGPSSLIVEKKFTKAFATGIVQRVQNINSKQEIIVKHTIRKAGQNIYRKYLQEREIEIINEFKMRMKRPL